MKIAEKATLRDYIESVDTICENFKNATQFYENVSLVPQFSLQSIAFEKDMQFLNEVSQILSIIASIISHPHLSNRREEVIVRAEQARQIQQDAFIRVMQDSSLWKNHKGEMKPENVYYYQYVDELRIYENQFIVLLINLLDVELARCNSFYLHKLPVVSDGVNVDFAPLQTSLSQDECAIAIEKTEALRRKITFVKNTYFYKTVSAGKPISPIIKPTNILLKDRLYCKCFKFYKKFVRYESEYTLKEDLAKYASFIILKNLNALGFKLVSIKEGKYSVPTGVIRKLIRRKGEKFESDILEGSEGHELVVSRAIAPFFNGATFIFENNGFVFNLQYESEEQFIKLDVFYPFNNLSVSHALCFDGGESEFSLTGEDKFTSIDLFSIWNCYSIEGGEKRILSGDFNESEMIKRWLLSKITVIDGKKEVYQKYCPVCKIKGVEENENGMVCAFCKSEYSFISNESNQQKVWITKIRRS